MLDELKSTAQRDPVRSQFRIPLLVAGAVVISLILVAVALRLYYGGIAAQLDLSRPGYQSVREQAGKDVDIDRFSATGGLSSEVFDSFDGQYAEQVKSITKLNAFDGSALTDAALGLPKISE